MIPSCFQDNKMSDHADFALDRQSNIRLFERLANPHMLDDRRLEELKQINEMRMRTMPRGLTVENDDDDENRSHAPTETDDRRSGHSRNSQSPSPNQSPRHSARSEPRSENSRRSSPERIIELSLEERPRESRLSARSNTSASSNRIDRKHHRFQPNYNNEDDLLPPPRTQPPPLPNLGDDDDDDENKEFERLQARLNAKQSQPLMSRRRNISSSPGIDEYRAPSSYNEMFRKVCQMRKRGMATEGGGANTGGEYRPLNDPDYAEKRELLIKLDELRTLGFNVPKMDPAMPLEDLQTEITRRTVSMGTVETVDTVIGWINSAATVLETLNNMAGPFLPMENYAQSVREGTQTPRFKYALYQLVLRHQGRHAGSPWRVVLMVLISPLIQGALVKLVQWMVKGRLNVSSGMIGTGLKTLFSMGKSKDPNKGVPAGIPGISPDIPKPAAATPAPPASSNPFASFFNAAASKVANSVKLPPTSTSVAAEGPVVRPPPPTNPTATTGKRVRLQRPSELNQESASEVGVITADQKN